MDDDRAAEVLNALDERTVVQKRLQSELANGFMWLARERYRDSLATHRKSFIQTPNRTNISKIPLPANKDALRSSYVAGMAHVASETREMESQIRISLSKETIQKKDESQNDDDDAHSHRQSENGEGNKDAVPPPSGTFISMQKTPQVGPAEETVSFETEESFRGEGLRRRRQGKQKEEQGRDDTSIQHDKSSLSSPTGENQTGNPGVMNMYVGMPSAEMRQATECFARAVDDAIKLSSLSGRVDALVLMFT